MTKEHGVVMLEAHSSPAILENTYINESKHGISPLECSGTAFDVLTQLPKEALENRGYKLHHLYFTSDDEIKEGDWWVNIVNKYIHQRKYSDRFHQENKQVKRDCKKIIATTNPELERSINKALGVTQLLSQIPQSFIEFYVKNPVETVELEYEVIPIVIQDYADSPSQPLPEMRRDEVHKLKLVNNEVVVVEETCGPLICKNRTADTLCAGGKCCREKLYTKEETEKLTHAAFLAGALANAKGQDMGEYWKWKLKNL